MAYKYPVTVAAPEIGTPGPPLRIVAPATGALLAEVPASSAAQVDAALERARRAQPEWEALGARGRGQALRRLARAIRDDQKLTELLVAARQIAVKDSSSSDAPPTRAPSTAG